MWEVEEKDGWPRVRKEGDGRRSDGILRPPFFYQRWCPGRARIIYLLGFRVNSLD